MAAPVKPEPTTEPPAQGSQPTPNNPPAAAPVEPAADNRRVLDLYEATLRENHQRITRMERELEEARGQAAAATATPPPQITGEDFWKNPAQHIRELIKEETVRAVKPLYEFKDKFEARSAYDTLKDRFRNDPRYKEVFPKIEGAVDQLLSNAKEINETIMNTAVLSAAGALALGMIPQPTGAAAGNGQPSPSPANPNVPAAPVTTGAPVNRSDVVTPPHLRPSGAGQAGDDPSKPKHRELTELEKRLARERGQTEEEYLYWLELPADKVVTSRYGLEKEKK